MDKYLIVKVPDADQKYEEPVTFNGHTKMIGQTVMSRIGSAVRLASEEHFVGATWVTTHNHLLTPEESKTVARIFEDVTERARRRNPKKFQPKTIK